MDTPLLTHAPEVDSQGYQTTGIALDQRATKGLIFDIQGHSVHDGPGTRTAVFLKGCPLSCQWCCNPEGVKRHIEMLYYESRCVHCGHCIASCPHQAISVQGNSLHHDRSQCDTCKQMPCIDSCLHEAKCQVGKYYSVEALMRVLKRDRHFWGAKGGVTFSGGEPLLQTAFIREVLAACKREYINVCIETTSYIKPSFYLEAMRMVNWAFLDIKHMDDVRHKQKTGVSNERILNNIAALAQDPDFDGVMIIRVPVIPGFNDSEDNIRQTARFVKSIGLDAINILPFHRMGESKYRQLDRVYPYANGLPPTPEHMQRLQQVAIDEGIMCFIGYQTPF